MESNRRPCSTCSREAMIETIERNQGLCEACASELRKNENTIDFRPRLLNTLGCVSLVAPVMIAGYVFYRCHQAEWGLLWNLIWAVFIFVFSFQGLGYLIGAVGFILAKMNVGVAIQTEANKLTRTNSDRTESK